MSDPSTDPAVNRTGLANITRTNIYTGAPPLIIAAASPYIRPANTTAYSANDAVSNNATAANVNPITFAASHILNAPLVISRIRVLSTDTGPGTASATFEMWLFNSDPTANSGVGGGDNAAFSQKQAGFIGIMSGVFASSSDGSIATMIPDDGAPYIITTPPSGSRTLYGLLKTLTAFTPSANSTTFNAVLEGIQGQ